MNRQYGKIRVAHDGAIARITLFNPERRNAIGPQMVNELVEVAARVVRDTGRKVATVEQARQILGLDQFKPDISVAGSAAGGTAQTASAKHAAS